MPKHLMAALAAYSAFVQGNAFDPVPIPVLRSNDNLATPVGEDDTPLQQFNWKYNLPSEPIEENSNNALSILSKLLPSDRDNIQTTPCPAPDQHAFPLPNPVPWNYHFYCNVYEDESGEAESEREKIGRVREKEKLLATWNHDTFMKGFWRGFRLLTTKQIKEIFFTAIPDRLHPIPPFYCVIPLYNTTSFKLVCHNGTGAPGENRTELEGPFGVNLDNEEDMRTGTSWRQPKNEENTPVKSNHKLPNVALLLKYGATGSVNSHPKEKQNFQEEFSPQQAL
jgi:hypothetical protein